MRKLLATIFALSAFFSASAQSYSYTTLSVDDGFPTTVSSIFVEKAGFAWLGADDALYLLYGNNAFSRHDTNQGYLKGNNIIQVCTDAHGVTWILTDKGFLGYNSRLNIEHPSIKQGLDGSQIAYCVLPKEDEVYFGGAGFIWKYDYRKDEFSTVCEFDDHFKVTNLLAGQHKGKPSLSAYSRALGEFYVIDSSDGSVISKDSLRGGFCAGFSDSRGYSWISLFDIGVFQLSPEGEEIRHYDSSNSRLSENNVLCFTERYGKIWMGSDGGGINVLDPWSGQIELLKINRQHSSPDPVTTVITMFCDHNGHVWCGRPNGGVLIISESHIEMFRTEDFSPKINTKGISYFYQDGDEDIWIGTYGSGILKYSPSADRFTGYPETDGLYIYSMARLDSDRIVLSCPNKGFYSFDKRTGQLDKFEPLSEYKYYHATVGDGVYVDNDAHGNILFFAHDIMRWDHETGQIEKFTPKHDSNLGYLHPVRGSMCQYVLDYTHIYKWNESMPDKLEMVAEYTEGFRFYCSTMSKDGIIYLGTGSRICCFDTETREFKIGKNLFDAHPSLMLSDDDGKLWVGTRNALYLLNPGTNNIATLGEVNGVANNEYVHQAKLQASNGDVYLGGAKGMVRVHSDFTLPSSDDPEIVVSGVNIDGKEIFDFGDLVIPANHNTVTIRFLVRCPDILAINRYRIYEEGPHGSKIEEEYSKPVINFRGLSPRRHTLAVATTAQDGRWTEPQNIFTFVVAAPWYGSWWAIALYIIGLASLGWYLYHTLSRSRTEEREKRTSEERYNFLINVSHELRTPLTLILGPLKRVLNDSELKDSHRDSIKKVCRQADRMATLLNTVLTTNKIENGATQIRPRPMMVNDLLERWADEFSDEAAGRNMEIIIKTDPAAGSVMMDPDMCRIVFSNIMSNALRHNNPGQSISVWSSADIKPGFVRIGIRDHGSGIGIVDVSKLFERYYRATEEHTGFGIGLSYAKTIIDAHGGKIGAFNNDNDSGATFWFELQRASTPGESITDAPEYVSRLTKTLLAKDLKDKTILFVDDSKDLRDYVDGEMNGLCKKMLLAYNGADALRVLVNHEVDVIVSDVMMPEIDGVELCRTIKSSPDYRHIPVILLSARVDEESKSRGYAVKADHYLSKPFDIKDLIAILDNKTKK